MLSEELKPCPFCGADVAVVCDCEEFEACNAGCDGCTEEKTYQVVCDFTRHGCGASTGARKTLIEAKFAWNHRAGDAS